MFLSKRNGIYHLFYFDEAGKRRQRSTGTNHKSDALQFLRTFREEERNRRRQTVTSKLLGDFTDEYLTYSRSIHTPKTVRASETALREFKKAVGDVPLSSVAPRHIEQFLAKKRQDASAWTSRKYYLALGAAFQRAKRWQLIKTNPFRQVDRPKTPELLPVYFTKADYVKLLQVVEDEDFRELILCATLTGMRLGELLALRWDAIDLERWVVLVANTATFTTKGKKNRTIPMSEALVDLLRGRHERVGASNPQVFHRNGRPMTQDNVTKRFKRYVRKAKLDDRLHFHSLRHTFASWLALTGVSLFAIQKLLGHANHTTTLVYSHLAPEQLHESVASLTVPALPPASPVTIG